MKTLLLSGKKKDIEKAADIVRKGGLVAFPTETVYGLGANALNAKASKLIFKAKGRPQDNPLIVHIADEKSLHELVEEVPKEARKLMKLFWPGPLTFVLKKKRIVPSVITCGMDTVAIRMPNHPVALHLIKIAGVPIAAPSANVSGRPSPTLVEHVISDLNGKIDAVIKGGQADIGVESTVIDLTTKPATLLRPGGVTFEELEKALGKGNVTKYHHTGNKRIIAKSPGMKYRHYSPKAAVILIEGSNEKVQDYILKLIKDEKKKGNKIGIISKVFIKTNQQDVYHVHAKTSHEFAKELFSAFRKFDSRGIDVIIAQGVEDKNLGLAVMNRLRKAAAKIIKV